MRKNMIRYLALVLFPVVCLLLWSGVLYYKANVGQKVIVSIGGYDPRDLLAGRYITYRVNWDDTDCSQFKDNVCPIEEFRKYGKDFGRFYVSEDFAKPLERDIRNPNNKAEIVFSYLEGQAPMVLNLLVNGKAWDGREQEF